MEGAVDDTHDDQARDDELEVGNTIDVWDIAANAEAEDREVEEVTDDGRGEGLEIDFEEALGFSFKQSIGADHINHFDGRLVS